MRVSRPAGLQSLHGCEIDQEHDEIEESDVVTIRIKPER